jgi:hypothetical protein
MAVFRIYRRGNGIHWSLVRGPDDPGAGAGVGEAIARSAEPYENMDEVREVINVVKQLACAAQLDYETDEEVIRQGNVRVGTSRIVAEPVPATPLASPSSIVSERHENDGDEAIRAAATGPRRRRASGVGRPFAQPASSAKPTTREAKPATTQAKPARFK